MRIASLKKRDLDADIATSANSTVASLTEQVANNITTFSAVFSESGATVITDESMTTPLTAPATRSRMAVNKSLTTPGKVAVVGDGAVAIVAKRPRVASSKATDSNLTSAVAAASPDDNNDSETDISINLENIDSVKTENFESPKSKNLVSPRKRPLKTRASLDPVRKKRAKSERQDSSTSVSSSVDKIQNSVLKQRRKKPKEVLDSPAHSLSPELRENAQKSTLESASNSDLMLTDISFSSETKDSAWMESLGNPKMADPNSGKVKKVRNPYGRRGKPGKHSTCGIYPNMKPKKSKERGILQSETKMDPSEPETVKREWLKPFEEGWRREIVYRNANADTATGRKCDIYYFTPDNCKLRSTPQIISYLSKQNTILTSSCFTFVKRLIYSEPAEFVRNAGFSGRRSDIATSGKLPKPHKRREKGKLEVVLQKPALKLKLKRKKFKKLSSHKVKSALSGSSASDVSMVTHDVDISKEEPQFRSTPLVGVTKPLLDSSLDASSSNWQLMKPKKALGKKSSSVLLKRTKVTGQPIVAKEDGVCPAQEVTKEVGACPAQEVVEVDGVCPAQEVTKEDGVCQVQEITKEDGVCPAPAVSETLTEALAPSGETKLPAAEMSQPQARHTPPEEPENKDNQTDSKLAQNVTSDVVSKVYDEAPAPKTLSKKKSNARSVARMSTAKRAKLVPKVKSIKVKMLYKEGLPHRAALKTNAPLSQESNHVSVTRSSDVMVTPGSATTTSSGATGKQTKEPPRRKCYNPLYNPVSDIRPCGLHCAGRFGMAPSLHCDICMCMFHPECVGIMHVPHRTSFTCKACYSLNADFCGSISFDDMTYDSRLFLPQSQRTDNCVSTSDNWASSATPLPTSVGHGAFLPVAKPQVTTTSGPISSTGVIQNVSVAGIDAAKPSGRVLSLPRSLASLLDLSRPVTLSLDGHKYNVPGSSFMVTPDGIKVVLPNDVFPNPSVPKTTLAPNVPLSTYQPFDSDQSSVHAGSIFPGKNLDVLPIQSEITPKMTSSERNREEDTRNEIHSSREPAQGNDSVEYLPGSGGHTNNGRLSNGNVSELSAATDNGRNIISDAGVADADCGVEDDGRNEGGCFSRVTMSADLMFYIFKFLNVAELLKAAQVCTTWLKITEHSSLWRSVTLSGIKVFNWDLAAQHLTKRRTKSLNLSRLVHSGSENQTWHQLTAAFSGLTTVRHLVFGPCPANLVYFAASKMAELESLKAVQIMDVGGENPGNSQSPRSRDTKLDVGKMAALRNLVHLELRGLHGLILPAFSFTGGLAELAQLTELQHLSITSLKGVPGKEFHFLSRLEKLQVLEVGDCKLWTNENYEHLGRLTRLKQLKLECGSDSQENSLGEALLSLLHLEHLELSDFLISKSAAESLSKMRQLKTLRLYSDSCQEATSMLKNLSKSSRSNSYMLSAVKRMKFLTELTWGIFDSDVQTGCAFNYCKGAHSEPQTQLPFLLETRSAEDEGKSSSVEWKSITELESVLREDLASTRVRVLEV